MRRADDETPRLLGEVEELEGRLSRRGPGRRQVLDPDFEVVPPWETEEPDVKTLEDFRSLVAEVVESVRIAPATKKGGRFDPSRVEIVWRSDDGATGSQRASRRRARPQAASDRAPRGGGSRRS